MGNGHGGLCFARNRSICPRSRQLVGSAASEVAGREPDASEPIRERPEAGAFGVRSADA